MDEENTDGEFKVTGPSGAEYYLLTQEEVDYYTDVANRYSVDNVFPNVSDKQELERILILELLCWRWSNWISKDMDYYNEPIDSDTYSKRIKDTSVEIRLIKKALGIDKSARDKDKGSSTAEYIENLLRRGKEFGYYREEQTQKALRLFAELSALLQLYMNTDELEQAEMHCTGDDVLKWLWETAIPEYNEIDKNFRKQQKYWVRDL